MADRPRQNRRRQVPDDADEVHPQRASLRERCSQRLTGLREQALIGLGRLRRPLLWLLRLSAIGALVAAGLGAGRLLERHLRSSKSFATRVVELSGEERLTRAELLHVAGLAEGQNVFEQSPEEAQERLIAHPWIATAHVTRRLPDTYLVDVVEHRPVAVLVLERLYLVGDDGGVFKPLEPGDPADLPVITGVDPEAFTNDRAFRTSLLISAVALLHDYRDVGLWRREPIAEIHVEHSENFSLYVGEQATFVRLGQRPFRKKLRRFRKVLDRLAHEKAAAEYVYLDNVRRPDRVTVRLK